MNCWRGLSGHFFAGGDFAKIMLPLWWEHSFQGAGARKNSLKRDSEQHRRQTSTKNAANAICGSIPALSDSLSVDFGGPRGLPEAPSGRRGVTSRAFLAFDLLRPTDYNTIILGRRSHLAARRQEYSISCTNTPRSDSDRG